MVGKIIKHCSYKPTNVRAPCPKETFDGATRNDSMCWQGSDFFKLFSLARLVHAFLVPGWLTQRVCPKVLFPSCYWKMSKNCNSAASSPSSRSCFAASISGGGPAPGKQGGDGCRVDFQRSTPNALEQPSRRLVAFELQQRRREGVLSILQHLPQLRDLPTQEPQIENPPRTLMRTNTAKSCLHRLCAAFSLHASHAPRPQANQGFVPWQRFLQRRHGLSICDANGGMQTSMVVQKHQHQHQVFPLFHCKPLSAQLTSARTSRASLPSKTVWVFGKWYARRTCATSLRLLGLDPVAGLLADDSSGASLRPSVKLRRSFLASGKASQNASQVTTREKTSQQTSSAGADTAWESCIIFRASNLLPRLIRQHALEVLQDCGFQSTQHMLPRFRSCAQRRGNPRKFFQKWF